MLQSHDIKTTNPPMSLADKAAALHHEKLVKQSKRLVSQTFFGAMLKQMRNSPFKSNIFDGGRGGEAFSTMLDQHLSEHMANAKSGQSMVASIVNKIEANERAKRGLKEPPRPHRKSPAQIRYERSSYSTGTARDGRTNVPADFRA